MSARRELDQLIKAHRARLDRGGRPVSSSDWEGICSLAERARRERPPSPDVYGVVMSGPLPDLDLLRIEFGIDETAPTEPSAVEPPAPTRRGRPPGEIDTWYDERLAEKLEIVKREGITTAGPTLRSIWTRGNELGYQLRWESFLDRWHALYGD